MAGERRAPPVLVVVGPTAVGKSALALLLAEALGGVVLNADSRQVYRYMDIGTAKATSEERARVPHRLLDLVDPDEPFSLALYLDHARPALEEVLQEGRVPLLVGGTGQYIWAVVEGWQVPRVPPDPGLRARLEEQARRKGLEALYRDLVRRDPESARFVDPRNPRRVLRALEVVLRTGRPFSAQRRKEPLPYRFLILGLTLPREDLRRRMDRRLQEMLTRGWPEEVRWLLEHGYTPDLPSFSSLGYREMARYVMGQAGLEETMEAIRRATWDLARRQYNWFRLTDPRIRWLEADAGAHRTALEMARAFLEETLGET